MIYIYTKTMKDFGKLNLISIYSIGHFFVLLYKILHNAC